AGPGGAPGAKKAETASFTPAPGWNTASVLTQIALPPGPYWLAYLPSNDGLGFRKAPVASGVPNSRYYTYAFGTMPATFATTTNSTTSHWSLYATLATSGSGDTTPPSTPTGLAVSSPGPTSLTLGWNASTDNVGVAGYTVSLNGSAVASST